MIEHGYRMRDVQRMLGVSRAVVTRLIEAKFVTPEMRGREQRFSFRDVVLLRTAHSLRAAGVPPRKIVRALEHLRQTLTRDGRQDLTAFRLAAAGGEVAVRHHDEQWLAESGQMLMDLEPKPVCGPASTYPLGTRRQPVETAAEQFRLGAAMENGGDFASAEIAYRRAIELEPEYLDAYLHLGCVLCERERFEDAIVLFRRAIEQQPGESVLHFNLGVALEDSGELHDALDAYKATIRLSPDFADAHFNAARIHQELGDMSNAIRHFNSYRSLTRTR